MTQPAAPSQTFVLALPAGVVVRDPETGRVALDGGEYPRSVFWQRMLNSGDVGERPPEDLAPAPAAAPAALRGP